MTDLKENTMSELERFESAMKLGRLQGGSTAQTGFARDIRRDKIEEVILAFKAEEEKTARAMETIRKFEAKPVLSEQTPFLSPSFTPIRRRGSRMNDKPNVGEYMDAAKLDLFERAIDRMMAETSYRVWIDMNSVRPMTIINRTMERMKAVQEWAERGDRIAALEEEIATLKGAAA